MVPTADNGVAVRFSQGDAAMVSTGRRGAVMLLPVRYNATDKLFFVLAGFNLSSRPINFGTEDVRIRFDNGPDLPVQDFDYLRGEAKARAQHEVLNASVQAAIDGALAYEKHKGADRLYFAAWKASGELSASMDEIERRLIDEVAATGRIVLQTTTIDPATVHAGAIISQQVDIPPGTVRDIVVGVHFGGETHTFRISMAASGTPTPVPEDIPAVPRYDMQRMLQAPETWHWNEPTPPATDASRQGSQ